MHRDARDLLRAFIAREVRFLLIGAHKDLLDLDLLAKHDKPS